MCVVNNTFLRYISFSCVCHSLQLDYKFLKVMDCAKFAVVS